MSRASDAAAALDRVLLVSRQQLALRALSMAATVGFLLVVPAAGGSPDVLVVAVLVLAGLGAAALPDTHAPVVLLLGLGWLWWGEVPEAFSGWTPVAAALLLTVHVACTLGDHGPPALRLPGAVLRVWTGRWVVLAAVAVLVWLASGPLRLVAPPRDATAVALGLMVVAGWVVLLLARLAAGDDEE